MRLMEHLLSRTRLLPLVILGLMSQVLLFAASQGQQVNDDSTSVTGTITGTVSSKWVKCDSVVIVYVDTVKGDYRPDTTKPIMNQINRVFVPHVLPILVGTTVRFTNGDSLDHNVFSPSKLKPFNIGTWGYGKVKDYTFDKTGVVLLLCNIHSEMAAVIMILQNPFFAVAGKNGAFTISGVPPGTYTLKAYHERMNEISKQVIVTAGDTTVVDFDIAL